MPVKLTENHVRALELLSLMEATSHAMQVPYVSMVGLQSLGFAEITKRGKMNQEHCWRLTQRGQDYMREWR